MSGLKSLKRNKMNSKSYYEDRMEKEDKELKNKNVEHIIDLYNLLKPLEKVEVRKLLMCQQIF